MAKKAKMKEVGLEQQQAQDNLPVVTGTLGTALDNAIKVEKGELLPTLDYYAEQEEAMNAETFKTRCAHYLKVIRDYGDDYSQLVAYSQKVRHLRAKALGIDLAKNSLSDLKKKNPAVASLYQSHCSNITAPFMAFANACKEHGKEKVIALLAGPGTILQKVGDAKVLLGKPVRTRGTKDPTGQDNKNPGTKGKSQIVIPQKDALGQVLDAVNNSLKVQELLPIIQACANRFATVQGNSKDDTQLKILGEKVSQFIGKYWEEIEREEVPVPTQQAA